METTRRVIRIEIDATRAREGGRQVEQSLNSIDSAVSRAKTAFQALVGYLSIRWAANFIKSALDTAGSLGELAEQLGVATDKLQVYKYAALQSGFGQEAMEKGLQTLTRRLGDAAEGSDAAVKAFAAIGVNVLDAGGKIRGTDAVLADIANKLQALPDPARRAALAYDLMGKSAQKMLPMLSQGAAGLANFEDQARRAGAILSQEQIEKADKASDSMKALTFELRQFILAVVAELGPAINSIIEWLRRKRGEMGNSPAQQMDKNFSDAMAIRQNLDRLYATRDQLQNVLVNTDPLTKLADRKGYDKIKDTLAATNEQIAKQTAEYDRLRQANINLRQVEIQADEERARRNSGDYGGSIPKGTEATKKAAEEAERHAKAMLDQVTASQKLNLELDDKIAKVQAETQIIGLEVMGTEEAKQKIAEINAQRNIEGILLDRNNKLRELSVDRLKAEKAGYVDVVALIDKDIDSLNKKTKELIDATALRDTQAALARAARENAELMAEPFKNAIRGIQESFTDFFVKVFEGGVKSFKDLAGSVKSIFIRLAAELATLLVIRPSLQILASTVGIGGLLGIGGGLVGGTGGALLSGLSLLSVLNGGGASSTGGSTGIGGLGSILDIFGGNGSSGGSSWFSGISSFLKQPIFGSATGQYTPEILGGLGGGPGLGGLTWGQGLGGLFGIGSGIFNIAQGNTIGGIAGIAGSVLSLAGLPMIGGIVSVLGGLLGSLFGGKTQHAKATAFFGMEDGQLGIDRYRALHNGPIAAAKSAGGAAIEAFNKVLDAMGGSLLGLPEGPLKRASGLSRNELFFKDNQVYAYAGGERVYSGKADEAGIKAAIEAYIVATFEKAASQQLITGISESLRKALASGAVKSIDDIQKAMDFTKWYDNLALAADAAKEMRDAVDQIRDSMKAAIETAKSYGLSIDPIKSEEQRQIDALAIGINDRVRRGLVGSTAAGQLQLALEDLDAAKAKDIASATYLNTVSTVLVDINKIEEYYAQQRLAIVEQYNGQLNASLLAFYQRITYGDLSGASPFASLSGARGSFRAASAQALAGSQTARASIEGYGTDYLTALRRYYGSGSGFAEGLAEVQNVVGQLLGGASGNPVVDAVTASGSELARLLSANNNEITALRGEVEGLREDNARLNDAIRRLLAA